MSKSTVTIRELLKFSSFFKDGQGNRYTLQMTGDTDNDGNDEYSLHRDHHHNPIGLYVYDNEEVTLVSYHAKNTCYVVINNIDLYPYIEKPVML